MLSPCPTIPWINPDLWHEANGSLASALQRNPTTLAILRRGIAQTRALLGETFQIMDCLCQQTCPTCTDSCCQRAWVWVDFKDLLFFHLAGIKPPKAQLIENEGDHCRYAGPTGCSLDRIQRPFVCTWYVCPAQTALLDNKPEQKRWLQETLNQIKILRREMEDGFIAAVA